MIDFSSYLQQLKFRKTSTSRQIFCVIRKKWLQVTPEEVVRQCALLYLLDLGYSSQHIVVERRIFINNLSRRFDIVVSNKSGAARILVECKAPEVSLGQEAIDQAGMYNLAVKGAHLWVTNGHQNLIYTINHEAGLYSKIQSLPSPE